MPRTLILGAGFGGLATATGLRDALGDEHKVVLVDSRERFSMGLRKLWELVGMGTIEEGSRPRELLNERGIDFRQAEITAIDPESRAATVDGETLAADRLVVALGAEARGDLVPGLDEHGLDVWAPERVAPAREALESFDGGRIAIVIAGAPYKCPPAPYELAMLLDEALRERGLRDRTEMSLATVQPILLPNAGREGSEWIGGQLDERGIAYSAARKIERIDEGRVAFADGELEFDLLFGVPPHRPPAVIADSGLTNENGWIGVVPPTLETAFDGVFAVGDVTQIKLANGLPMPKAGVIAELEGTRVAEAIVAQIRGEPEPPPFDGHGYCFIEMGKASASLVEGEFFVEPEPRVGITEPSAGSAQDKHRFETERLERWFGT